MHGEGGNKKKQKKIGENDFGPFAVDDEMNEANWTHRNAYFDTGNNCTSLL